MTKTDIENIEKNIVKAMEIIQPIPRFGGREITLMSLDKQLKALDKDLDRVFGELEDAKFHLDKAKRRSE